MLTSDAVGFYDCRTLSDDAYTFGAQLKVTYEIASFEPRFSPLSIRQATPVASADNILTLRFGLELLTQPIGSETVLEIWGLGQVLDDGEVVDLEEALSAPLSGGDATSAESFFCLDGRARQAVVDRGWLKLAVCSAAELHSYTTYQVSFRVKNPASSQPSPQFWVRATQKGEPFIVEARPDKPSGGAAAGDPAPAASCFPGWRKVRHVRGHTGLWHPATDDLAGTDEYGTPHAFEEDWSVRFDAPAPQRYLFANGHCTKWMVASRAAVGGSLTGEYYSGVARDIEASSVNEHVAYQAVWYNRDNKAEDPWISAIDHLTAAGTNLMMYGESSNVNHAAMIHAEGGYDVWIPDLTSTSASTPSPVPPADLMDARGYSDPLFVLLPSFLDASIEQANPSPSQLNTLTVAFVPTVQLAAGDRITICGLLGATMDDAPVLESPHGGNRAFCSGGLEGVAEWIAAASSLVLRVCEGRSVAAFSAVSLSFKLWNPAQLQAAPEIAIQSPQQRRTVLAGPAGDGGPAADSLTALDIADFPAVFPTATYIGCFTQASFARQMGQIKGYDMKDACGMEAYRRGFDGFCKQDSFKCRSDAGFEELVQGATPGATGCDGSGEGICSGGTCYDDCYRFECNQGFERVNGTASELGTCVKCARGHFKADVGNGACVPCPSNTFASFQGARECVPCPPHSVTLGTGAAAASQCACSPGFVAAASPTGCEACPPGTFQEGDACTECPAGTYREEAGGASAAECMACSAGQASAAGSANRTACSASGLLIASAAQDNPVAGAPNTLSLTLRSSAVLRASDHWSISVSGLHGATVQGSEVVLGAVAGGNGGELLFCVDSVAARGQFVQNGKLLLTLCSDLEADIDVAVSFSVTNPQAAQDAPDLLVSAEGAFSVAPSKVRTSGQSLHGVERGADPMRVWVAAFTDKYVSQTTPIPGARNVILASLKANIDLDAMDGWRITISGLALRSDAEPQVELGGDDSHRFCVKGSPNTARMVKQAGNGYDLVLGLCDGARVVAGEDISVQFTTTNSDSMQQPVAPMLEAAASVPWRRIEASPTFTHPPCSDAAAPMHVLCPAGSYFSDAAGDAACVQCEACPVGQYEHRPCSFTAATDCKPCKEGAYSSVFTSAGNASGHCEWACAPGYNLVSGACVSGSPVVGNSKPRAWMGDGFLVDPATFPTERYSYGMATLPPDLIFVWGGAGSAGLADTDMHVYDVAASQWSRIPSTGAVPESRRNHGMCHTGGNVYVQGGEGRTAELYAWSTSLLTWTVVETSGSGPPDYLYHHAMVCMLETVYVALGNTQIGGTAGASESVYAFDVNSRTWSVISSATTVSWRWRFGAAAIDDTIWFFGGLTSNAGSSAMSEMVTFNTTSREWADVGAAASGTPPSARQGMVMQAIGQDLYLYGGFTFFPFWRGFDDFYKFSTVRNTWTEKTIRGDNPPTGYSRHMASMGGRLFIFAGNYGFFPFVYHNQFHMYNPRVDSWTQIGRAASGAAPAASRLASVFSYADQLYVFGGDVGPAEQGIPSSRDGGAASATVHRFDPDANAWTEIAAEGSIPARAAAGLTVVEDTLWLFGGYDGPQFFNDLYRVKLSDSSFRWERVYADGPTPEPRSNPAMEHVDGRIFVIDGWCDRLTHREWTDSYFYDIAENRWVRLENQKGGPVMLISHGAALVGRSIYFFGKQAQSQGTAQFLVFDTDTFQWSEITDAHGEAPDEVHYPAVAARGTMLFLCGGKGANPNPDCFSYDTERKWWTNEGVRFGGLEPLGRWGASLVLVGDRLFLYGGEEISGTGTQASRDLYVAPFATRRSVASLLELRVASALDFDTILVPRSTVLSLAVDLQLGRDSLPTALRLEGEDASSVIVPVGEGSISCFDLQGCIQVEVTSLTFACQGEQNRAVAAALQVSGLSASLSVRNTTFSGCHSSTNGGAISAMSGAEVNVDSSLFVRCASEGSGGAMFLEGARTLIRASRFEACSAGVSGGGIFCEPAVLAKVIGSTLVKESNPSQVLAIDSEWEACRADSEHGGAVHAESSEVIFISAIFSNNLALRGGGGAVYWSLLQPSSNFESLLDLCVRGGGNQALYGNCVASNVSSVLQVENLVGFDGARPGRPLQPNVHCILVDFYGEQVKTLTVPVQAFAVAEGTYSQNEDASLTGQFRDAVDGLAVFDMLAVTPSFVTASLATQTSLSNPPAVYFQAVVKGLVLRSAPLSVRFLEGNAICESGSVLQLQSTASSSGRRQGSCQRCAAGKYSINALASPSGPTADPACYNCPRRSFCPGGDLLEVDLRDWDRNENIGEYRLLSCPSGTQLVNTTDGVFDHDAQQCQPCLASEYVVDPNRHQCQSCPIGGFCDGSKLTPFTAGSRWRATSDGILRVEKCPPGFVLVREESNPTADECLECPAGTYAVRESRFEGEDGRLWSSKAVNPLKEPMCRACPRGLECLGGNHVRTQEDFWAELPAYGANESTFDGTAPTQRRDGEDDDDDDGVVHVFPCPPGACLPEFECKEGHEGPVCGICKEGYAMSGSSCVYCGDQRAISLTRDLMMSTGTLAFAVVYFYFGWRPFFKRSEVELQSMGSDTSGFCSGIVSSIQTFFKGLLIKLIANRGKPQEVQEKIEEWMGYHDMLKKNLPGYIKIVISFYQVVSSFRASLNIRWPERLSSLMDSTTILKLDVLLLPGPSCVISSMPYLDRVLLYVFLPMGVCMFLAIPVLVARKLGESWHQGLRLANVVDQFWYNVIFFLFVIYPTVSVSVLSTFSCQDLMAAGNRLTADFREPCPNDEQNLLFWFSLIFTFVYPLGIPLFFLAVMYYFQVPAMAKLKKQNKQVEMGIGLYRAQIMTAEGAQIVRRITTTVAKQNHCFDEVVTRMFHDMDKDQNGYISQDEMKTYMEKEFGISLRNESKEWLDYLSSFAGENGQLSHQQSTQLVNDLFERSNRFTGEELLEDLSPQQLKVLCSHSWKEISVDDTSDRIATMMDEQIEKLQQEVDAEKLRKGNGSGDIEEAQVGDEAEAEQAREAEMAGKSVEELREVFLEKLAELEEKGCISLPTLEWDGSLGEREGKAIRRIGFLFGMYECKAWYFEMVEMARKLMMTSVLVFVYPGTTSQIAAGHLICFAALIINFIVHPFLDAHLDKLQIFSLLTQTVTLFYGIMLVVQAATEEETSAREKNMMAGIIVTLNSVIFVFPLIQYLLDRQLTSTRRIFAHVMDTASPWLCCLTGAAAQVAPAEAEADTEPSTSPQGAPRATEEVGEQPVSSSLAVSSKDDGGVVPLENHMEVGVNDSVLPPPGHVPGVIMSGEGGYGDLHLDPVGSFRVAPPQDGSTEPSTLPVIGVDSSEVSPANG